MSIKHKAVSIFSLVVFIMLISCSLSDKELQSGWWKYGKGYHIGDMVDFDGGFSLKEDTILQNGRKVGVITRKTKGALGSDNEIEVASLDGKQIGIYHQK